MVRLEINNQTNFQYPKKELKKEAQELLEKVGITGDCQLSIAIVKEDRIQEINKKWRDKDKRAGVLSFVEKEIQGEFYEPQAKLYLGEVFLCPDYIKKQAKKSGKDSEQEFLRYFRHGLLHLAGLNHKQMEEINKSKNG